MNPNNIQGVPITCPNCKTRFRAPVLPIVDVGRNPQAKALFLSGQLNVAVCPQCGHGGMLQTPLVYHDPEKELLLTFAPPELGLSEIEQQRIVGDLTNRVIQALPPEQRKGYLLRPRNYLRMEALMKDVLEAEGITQEMLERQRARMDLLERLVRADRGTRRAIARANDETIDLEFMDLLALNVEAAEGAQQDALVSELLGLRQDLLESTTIGHEMAARAQAIQSLGQEITREGLLDKLVEAALADEPIKIETMVAVARPAIDYAFYQQLADLIASAEQAGDRERAEKLRALRESVLELSAEVDREAEMAAQQVQELLQEGLESDDPAAWLRDNANQIDNIFLSMLSASLRAAEERGQTELAGRLRRLNEAVMDLILEGQPFEIQLINRLLSAEYPTGTQALLDEHRGEIGEGLLEMMDRLADDLRHSGREDAAAHLARIREQAAERVNT